MNVFSRFLGSSDSKKAKEISEVVPLAECSSECASCSTKFPSSLKIDQADLYKSAKETDVQFVVPTGKSDWEHDATSTPNTVENEISNWIDRDGSKLLPGKRLKVATSSLPIDLLDKLSSKGQVQDVLILPFFIWVRKLKYTDVYAVLNELLPILYDARESSEHHLPVTEVKGYKIEADPAKSYVFLCSHSKRDKRCGITAPLMKKEMDNHLRDLGYYRDIGDDRPDGVHVKFVNHVGGHKFAANVIIFNRAGQIIWLARCTPKNCVPIIDQTVLGGGKVWPELVRVVQKTKPIEW